MIRRFRRVRDARKPLLNSRGGVKRRVRDDSTDNYWDFDWRQAAQDQIEYQESAIFEGDDLREALEHEVYEGFSPIDSYEDQMAAVFSPQGLEALKNDDIYSYDNNLYSMLVVKENPDAVCRDILWYYIQEILPERD